MKHLFFTVLALLSYQCIGQELKDPLDERPPALIVQTGIGFQWLGESYKLYSLSVERPRDYWHLGVQGTFYLVFISPKLDHPFRSKLNHPELPVKESVKIGLIFG
jgi:hypothetical protein